MNLRRGARRPAGRPETLRTFEDGRLPSLAVITMCRDEGPMIRRWVEHYARQVGAENVYVIDDHSTDGSTDDLGCNVLRFPVLDKFKFERSRMTALNGLAASLLASYDAVLTSDADEFVVADPDKHAGLRELVASVPDVEAVGVVAYNVVHNLAREDALSFDRPFLRQRKLAKFMPLMCKPALKWAPADWRFASHGLSVPYSIAPDLYMFHMKFADRATLQRIADARNEGGRTVGTSWRESGDSMVDLLERINRHKAKQRRVPFEPTPEELAAIVEQKDDGWKATGHGQVQGMRVYPYRVIPARFADLV